MHDEDSSSSSIFDRRTPARTPIQTPDISDDREFVTEDDELDEGTNGAIPRKKTKQSSIDWQKCIEDGIYELKQHGKDLRYSIVLNEEQKICN